MALADQSRQAHGAAVDQGHAPPPAVHAEHGVAGRHPQVAPERQLEAAGHGMPLHRGHDRLVEQHAAGPHGPVGRNVDPDPVAAATSKRLEVGAGAERPPRPGENGHEKRVVGLETAEGGGQIGGGGLVDGVADLGPVDDHHRDRRPALVADHDRPRRA